MANGMTVEKRISKAKVGLILNHPWFGQLAMKLSIENGESIGVDTMATDGTRLYYSDKFVESITDAELLGVTAHEVLHCAMLHPYRRDNRDMKQWNMACDYVINDTLISSGFTLPKGGLHDTRFTGLSSEKAYAMLGQDKANGKPEPKPCPWGEVKDAPKPDAKGQGQGQDDKGKGQDGKGDKGQGKPDANGKGKGQGQGNTQGQGQGDKQGQGQGTQQDSTPDRTETDWKIDVIQAEKVATAAGKMPGGLSSELRKTRQTKTNYREVLKRFIDRTVPCDYSWSNPNRRMLSQGQVLPGVYKENCGEIVIGVDTSGSVGHEMLDQFAADIASIIAEYRPTKTHVIYCDAVVSKTAEFEPDSVPFEFEKNVRRGGTKFQPVFDHVEENGIVPRALIYLTDLEPCDRPEEPSYPVLWGVPETCTRKSWDWGEVVEITMDRAGAGGD